MHKKYFFREGLVLIENELSSCIKNASSILFVFQGKFDVYPPKAKIEKYLKKEV